MVEEGGGTEARTQPRGLSCSLETATTSFLATMADFLNCTCNSFRGQTQRTNIPHKF